MVSFVISYSFYPILGSFHRFLINPFPPFLNILKLFKGFDNELRIDNNSKIKLSYLMCSIEAEKKSSRIFLETSPINWRYETIDVLVYRHLASSTDIRIENSQEYHVFVRRLMS
ncbi:hypothetical protein AVEN_129000-1 [Araneus ventricosus]|uniref:Uncharacterized protein n=1 Tax=Araneus ventricosus TaxID=182803 RepID=A0A4Y2GCG6_ARAVE|nr:hypothetical protein AVEN_129000-1 [Araneus ventricosus]